MEQVNKKRTLRYTYLMYFVFNIYILLSDIKSQENISLPKYVTFCCCLFLQHMIKRLGTFIPIEKTIEGVTIHMIFDMSYLAYDGCIDNIFPFWSTQSIIGGGSPLATQSSIKPVLFEYKTTCDGTLTNDGP